MKICFKKIKNKLGAAAFRVMKTSQKFSQKLVETCSQCVQEQLHTVPCGGKHCCADHCYGQHHRLHPRSCVYAQHPHDVCVLELVTERFENAADPVFV